MYKYKKKTKIPAKLSLLDKIMKASPTYLKYDSLSF